MTKRSDRERDFERRLRARMSERVDAVDEDTSQRLVSARRAALAQVKEREPVSLWLPAGALAASVALIAVFATMRDEPVDGPGDRFAMPGEELIAESSQGEDLEMMYSDDDLELYEDLEFLQWLNADGDSG